MTLTDFQSLGLPALLTDSLTAAGFIEPTKIQANAIPKLLEGRDMMGIAQTGSGKTAAFGLPILAALLNLNGRPKPMTTRALILAPTRELAVQIDESLRKFAGAKMKLDTVLLLGGVSRYHQIKRLERGVDITVATPGRLKDLMDDGKIRLAGTKFLVLDEADRMLDMGFIVPVRQIVKAIGAERQTMMFSATMAPNVADLAKSLLQDPVRVEASVAGSTVVKIDQRVILSGTKAKRGVLNELLSSSEENMERVIVFSRTKHGADRVAKNLASDGHSAAAIHGNKSQNARQAALKGFTKGSVRILVATDIAARGIDVPGISHVVNYELPDDPENYVHRIGRTGRNGASGIAITLCDATERGKLRDVERLIRLTLPVTGDLHTANHTGVVEAPVSANRAPKQGRPAARDGQKPRQPRQERSGDGRGSSFTDLANALGKGGERHKPSGARPDGQKFRARRGKGGGKPNARAASWA
ncbi:DEAD/DEAH box helicase [Pelagibacterium limicola]|uniref:DEAD/DEAH box helicase n=1 Tax=Pelagibacterium limicola TaxID=2791022 RepID=UPI0018AFA470|nr:DEAD/DEAH box helicase [Pelagibacterium limicola]